MKNSNDTKGKKTTVRDLRPIALTSISYKICAGIIKDKIEEHMRISNLQSELQAGFTSKRRSLDNLYILKYCIEETFKKKKELNTTAIDFKKAYNSIQRDKLTVIMKRYGIHSNIINFIMNIYKQDKTNIYLNDEKQTNIKITSGIRQGCNC